MPKFEAIFNASFGQIRIPFDHQSELEDRLKELDVARLSETVSAALGTLIPRQPRQVKPGLGNVCRFRDDGLLEFLSTPRTQLDAVGLVLYAYDPEAVDVEGIRRITGLDNPVGYLGHKQYKKYFDRSAPGKYRLSHPGKIWVTNQVIPQLTKTRGSNE